MPPCIIKISHQSSHSRQSYYEKGPSYLFMLDPWVSFDMIDDSEPLLKKLRNAGAGCYTAQGAEVRIALKRFHVSVHALFESAVAEICKPGPFHGSAKQIIDSKTHQ
jgi:hypothetical protein